MKGFLNETLGAPYKSFSQKIRVLSERWVAEEIFCPQCGTKVSPYKPNRPATDFYCSVCGEQYELKSKADGIGLKIVDGAYETTVERLRGNDNPNFFLLNYQPSNYEVLNFFAIPKYFFVPEIIEKRKPLSQNARRAGWVGCNIILRDIPEAGKVFYIKGKVGFPKNAVMESWQKTLFLGKEPEVKSRAWTLDVMNCIDRLAKKQFVLSDVYEFEGELKSKHPRNLHVKDKIRQQLQVLRENGYLEFLGQGAYRLV